MYHYYGTWIPIATVMFVLFYHAVCHYNSLFAYHLHIVTSMKLHANNCKLGGMGNEILCCLVHQVKTSSKPTGVGHSCFCNFLPPSYSNIFHVSLHLLLPMCVYDIDSTFLKMLMA